MLSQQVEAYHQWKKELLREIARYQSWLEGNQLYSDDIRVRIERGMQLLSEDELTIAFVGEFSRGKTELINALFFTDYGQRMLPSQAGRTTMCPTELFFDREHNGCYVKLLPIEARKSDLSLIELKKRDDEWVTHALDTQSTDRMKETMSEVARVKSVTREEAHELGFSDDMLDADRDHAGMVIVPAWRHALISFDHPLLAQGLRILDTPGLNALGSEPELTISMLPSAHAVIFLLSADTGVTASDMQMWKSYIATDNADHRAGRFAVLNKIDVLWDDLQGDDAVRASIRKIQQFTADHLNMPLDSVIPVSAKQGLIGKVKSDGRLIARSELPALERLISDRILTQKEQLITSTLINDLLGMLQNSQAILQSRMTALEHQRAEIDETSIDRDYLKQLAEQTQKDHDFYFKKLITLRSSRRLMKSQGDILLSLVSDQRLEKHIEQIQQQLQSRWTTVGMYRSMDALFELLENDFNNLMSEARLAEKMVGSIYNRYKTETKSSHLQPTPFRVGRHINEMRDLRKKTMQFRFDPSNLLLGQQVLIKRFLTTVVSEVRRIHEEVRKEAHRWPDEALLPILQYTLEQKQLMQHQVKRLRELSSTYRSARDQKERLGTLVADSKQQLDVAESIQRQVRKPAPTLMRQKVVNLTAFGR